jgi:hypothetical protein
MGFSAPAAAAMASTLTFLILMAMASPIWAPSTATGAVTLCEPRALGVIMADKQVASGVAMIVPPLCTGPSILDAGPMISTRSLAKTIFCASPAFAKERPNKTDSKTNEPITMILFIFRLLFSFLKEWLVAK